MLAAVTLGAIVPAESASEPAVREAPETAFGEVVARAVAKGTPGSSRARDARAGESAESGDAALCAYVAALVSQAPTIPLPQQAEEAAGNVVQGAAAQGGAALSLAAAMYAAPGMPQAQAMPGAQASVPQFVGEPAPSVPPQHAQPGQSIQGQSASQPSFAGQATLANPRIRQKAQAAEAVNAALTQEPGGLTATDPVSASPKPEASAPDPAPAAELIAAGGNAGAGAESSAANRSSVDRYAEVQAQVEKAATAGKSDPSERVFGAEDAAPRPADERRSPQESVLLAQQHAEPVLGADKPAEAQRPEAATSPREADAAAQLFRATTTALARGETRYRLKLRPVGLGEVAVSISARDRELHLTIRTQSESTREIILNQIGALKLELASGEYRLSGFSVDVSGGGAGGEAFSAFQDGQERRNAGERHPEAHPTPAADVPLRGAAPEMRAGTINLRA